MRRRFSVWLVAGAILRLAAAAHASYVNFESGPVRPLAFSPTRSRLFVVNTPDNQLEIFDLDGGTPRHRRSVPVGLEPVAVAVRSETEVWVVNHLSDSVSIVDVGSEPPRVVRTLWVGDEPGDIVFAGAEPRRAYVTAAHRGQNAPFDSQLSTPGIGRADVWVFDPTQLGDKLGGTPRTIVNLFCDTPRALAVSPDGATVYAAAFHSGNETTTVTPEAICDGGSEAPACMVDDALMPGGLPAPNRDSDGVPGPEVGLIVRRDPGGDRWRDELGRDWTAALPIDLPDLDVFAIDAAASEPVVRSSYAHVGTVLYGMAVNPISGVVYVANTEARNEIRFESRVRGHQHESRISMLADGHVSIRHLNKHLDYSEEPSADDKRRSLALPVAAAVSSDGETLYLAAFGSGRVGVFATDELAADTFVPDSNSQIVVSGGGASGLILDDARHRLYVATRFDNGLSVIDTASAREIDHLQLHSAEPAELVNGRRFLYDAELSSNNGEATCASCHVFGDFDSLAWDLGDPDGSVLNNPIPQRTPVPAEAKDFHPLKGPMTTQTFRGIGDSGSMHWRGDRTGGNDVDGDPFDPRAAFRKFDIAFAGLLGRATPATAAEMDAFADFALHIMPPPNPIRALDNRLSDTQQRAADVFFNRDVCTKCHKLDPAAGQFGTDGFVVINPNPGTKQVMKIPSLRGLYQKLGRFGIFPTPFGLSIDNYPVGFLGDQVRGFGYLNDGAGILPPETGPFLLVFDTNLAPIVGQQVTVDQTSSDTVVARLSLLRARADADECDLIAKGNADSRMRGWLYSGNGTFLSDRAAEGAVTSESLAELAANGSSLTYTCAPPGTGMRLALDRDEDGFWDGDELDAGSDPADAASYPGGPVTPTPTPTATQVPMTPTAAPSCVGDCDQDGSVTVDEILKGVNMALGALEIASCRSFDASDDDLVTVDELVRGVNNALVGCGRSRRNVHVGECTAYNF